MTAVAGPKPRWRGVSHLWSFFVWIPIGVAVVTTQLSGEWIAALVYVLCVSAMFGLSALYHRVDWSDRLRPHMLQLDKTGIYLMIAGSFTPIAVNLDGARYDLLLVVVWSLTAVLIAALWVPWTPPYGTITTTMMAVGWLGLLAIPAMADQFGVGLVVCIVIGGLFFSVGAVLLALRRPKLWPETFGYHELWHVLVIVGALVHFAGLALYVFSGEPSQTLAG